MILVFRACQPFIFPYSYFGSWTDHFGTFPLPFIPLQKKKARRNGIPIRSKIISLTPCFKPSTQTPCLPTSMNNLFFFQQPSGCLLFLFGPTTLKVNFPLFSVSVISCLLILNPTSVILPIPISFKRVLQRGGVLQANQLYPSHHSQLFLPIVRTTITCSSPRILSFSP